TEHNTVDGRFIFVIRPQGLPGADVPHAELAEQGAHSHAGSQPRAIGAEGNTVDNRAMSGESAEKTSGARVPHLHGRVAAARGEPQSVRAEAERGYRLGVSGESERFLAGLRVPELDGPVVVC